MNENNVKFFGSVALPMLEENREVENGEFKTAAGQSYRYKDVTVKLSVVKKWKESLINSTVIPIYVFPPPMEEMFDDPLEEHILDFGKNEMATFGWWSFSKLVNLHPIIKRHQAANLLFNEEMQIVGLTYLQTKERQPQFRTRLMVFRDSIHAFMKKKAGGMWRIEIRKSIFSKLQNTNIKLPRYMFKDNKLLQDGIIFKLPNTQVMLWEKDGEFVVYDFNSKTHLCFPIEELPISISDKTISKLLTYNEEQVEQEWWDSVSKPNSSQTKSMSDEHKQRMGLEKSEYFVTENTMPLTHYSMAKGVLAADNKLYETLCMAVKLLAAYCTPTLKKGIKKISKKAPRLKNRRANMTTPTKWVWGTNKVTYIYPEQRRGKGVDEYYSRPTMAKYYITKLEKYADRPIYEEENENPRYRHSIIRSRAGCWKGGKEKLFVAGGEKRNYSQKAITWLKRIAKETGHNIQHAENGKEFRIELGQDNYYLADGYCKETNTVYEFNGDYWHGNPKVYDQDEINKSTKTSFGELYQRTLQKERVLKQMGFNVVSVWESDWVC